MTEIIRALFDRNRGSKVAVARRFDPPISKQMVSDVLNGRRKSVRIQAAIREVAQELIAKEAKEQQEALANV